MTTEQIIKEGNELKHSAKSIAERAEQNLIEAIITAYAMRKPKFDGLTHLPQFREFLESITHEKK